MRVLIADRLPEQARVRLASGGCTVKVEALSPDVLASFDPDVLIVRSTTVTPEHLAVARSLSLIVRAGAGVDTIDMAACSERGVYVSSCPGRNAVAVAELAMGLILALDRRLPENISDLRAGRWNKKKYSVARGLKGRTLGIIGLGRIGSEVAMRALAFGMHVIAWSRSANDDRMGHVMRVATPEDVARGADVVSVHLALTPETRGFVGASVFREMKHGALFINTARAEVVDEAELIHAMDTRGIRAGLDVFAGEPSGGEADYVGVLASHPSVYGTHHIGASTDQAQEAVADEACRVTLSYKANGTVPNCLNLARRSAADRTLVVRHRDRVGVLAAILGVLREDGINVEEMENVVFAGGAAACARIQIHGCPTEAALHTMRAHADVLSANVVALDPSA